MSVQMDWDNQQKTALRLTFVAPWTWDEYEQISGEIAQAFASVPHPVDLIIDVTQAVHIPAEALYQLRDAYADTTTNLGQYILAGASPEFERLFTAADRHYTVLGGQLRYVFVDDLTQARLYAYTLAC